MRSGVRVGLSSSQHHPLPQRRVSFMEMSAKMRPRRGIDFLALEGFDERLHVVVVEARVEASHEVHVAL
jgi:hypothetical protein